MSASTSNSFSVYRTGFLMLLVAVAISILLQSRVAFQVQFPSGYNFDLPVDDTSEKKAAVAADGTVDLNRLEEDFFTEDKLADVTSDEEREENEQASLHDLPKSDVKTPHKPLNVVIFYPDDWRHDSLGCAESSRVVQTPFLDRLASEGMRFTYNCVTTSICWISRATMYTGQYASRHRSIKPMEPHFYETWNASFPYLLQKNGYYVGHIGKWQYADYSWVKKQYNWTELYEGYHWFPAPNGTFVHTTDMTTEHARKFLHERPKDRPFVVTLAYYAPKAVGDGEQFFSKNSSKHLYENDTVPYPANIHAAEVNASRSRLPSFFKGRNEGLNRYRQRWDTPTKYQRLMKNYYRLITEVDGGCETVYNELDRLGLLNETIVIFTADNGFFHAEHGLGGKWFPYQESIRVPLIIKDPRMPKEKIGTVDDSFTLNIDLAETILGAGNIAPDPTMQGRDIADIYLTTNGKKTWRTEFFYEHRLSESREWLPDSTALVRKDFKYFNYPEWKYEQLFHIAEDPQEEFDVKNRSEFASILAEMRSRHDELKASVI